MAIEKNSITPAGEEITADVGRIANPSYERAAAPDDLSCCGNRRFGVAGIDLLLIAAAVVIFATGGLLLWLSPGWWRGYLTVLDVRCWPPWKAIALVLALTQALVVIRHWPEKKREGANAPTDPVSVER